MRFLKTEPNELLLSIVCISLILLLSGCGHNQKEKLVIYSPHGKELLGDFEKLYKTKHPDIDVQWLDMGSQEVFDRVSTTFSTPEVVAFNENKLSAQNAPKDWNDYKLGVERQNSAAQSQFNLK